MTIEAKVIADSISPAGARITTFELRYPRVIHPEVLTHRSFSRNASSSRAIPLTKMLRWVIEDPYIPIHWGRNRPGMLATEELDEDAIAHARIDWLAARDQAVLFAKSISSVGVHKQIVNRLIEPWAHINVVVTATSFANFFALRMHKAAMPEIQCLAVKMARAYRDSEPSCVREDGLHLPYVLPEEKAYVSRVNLFKVSAARCARVSYRTFDGKVSTLNEDMGLYDELAGSEPIHASPLEHQAKPLPGRGMRSGNLVGWQQHRKWIAGENAIDFDWHSRLVEYEGRDFVV